MGKVPVRQINVTRKVNLTQKEPVFSDNFSIRDIGGLLAEGDMLQELHRHDFFYILFLEKGKGDHIIDFNSYTICDHSVFVMRPGQVHSLLLKAESTGYLIQFVPDFYNSGDKLSNQLLRKASKLNCYPLSADSTSKIQVVLNYIFQEYMSKQEGYQEVIKAGLNIFFIEMVRQQQYSKVPFKESSPYMQERLDEFLQLLETHILSHKQVSQYAEMLNLSNYQLNTITKTTLGKTCSQLINEYVILESKRYILATSDQVNQLAYHLGFEDVSYFIRFFKKHTGYSPEAFRNN
ncbi:AraC-like DNA-binding protein [Pedobacter cryoconitis]|uniref:AraC-like DNA-binding protein n=1 Tax=Pedobacter cryoconitis TaxID=188932 RepID=A0A7W8ZPC1_9SPHI|nr:AraC family transcriptional regulator [Pedobacter cryoconitis]MBB5637706.1 AraC-like DNA-binding protein [Pedobacter cryoconitis]